VKGFSGLTYLGEMKKGHGFVAFLLQVNPEVKGFSDLTYLGEMKKGHGFVAFLIQVTLK